MIRSAVLLSAVLMLPSGGGSAWATSPPDGAFYQGLDSLFASIPHTTFEWVEAEGLSERAAIRLPVTMDGVNGSFQLDTGLDVTLVYGEIPRERRWETHNGMVHAPRVQIGDIDLGPRWFHARPEEGQAGQLSGSFGLDLLIGSWVLIDYPGQRMAILDPGDVPLWILQRATWTPAEVRHAKLFLTVTLGGETVEGLIFDTGSSAFDIVVDFETWRELTGRTGPEDAPVRMKVNSWGKKLEAIGAPAQKPLVIGSARIEEPRLCYLEQQPNLFSNWPFPATGLVGNAPFWDRVVILDLGIRPRFGMLRN